MTEDRALLRKRLTFLCRRGMREMDMLLDRWLAQKFSSADDAAIAVFQRLLDTEDDQLWDWIIGKQTPADAELKTLVAELCSLPPNQA
jgi:antitoxin CptB